MLEKDKIMTTRELAKYMKLNEKTVLKMAQRSEIPGVKIGSQWRFHLETVDQYLHRDILTKTPDEELDMIIQTSQQVIPLSRLVAPELIDLDLKAGNKSELLAELAEIACRGGILTDKRKLIEQLKSREKMLSTAMGHGVAIPHPRYPDPGLFKHPNIVIGRSKKGLNFSSPDGKKVHLFFMTCAPTIFVHLRLLAKISKMLHTESVIKQFMDAGKEEDITRVLLDLERKHLFTWEMKK